LEPISVCLVHEAVKPLVPIFGKYKPASVLATGRGKSGEKHQGSEMTRGEDERARPSHRPFPPPALSPAEREFVVVRT
jgi:hypothetical protein